MKIRIELTEKEIRNLAMAIKPVYEIDGLEHYETDFSRNVNKLVDRICADENHCITGAGYTSIVGNNAVRINIDSKAIDMVSTFYNKLARRFVPVMNNVVRFMKSFKELFDVTGDAVRQDAKTFWDAYNKAFPVEREWKLVTVQQAHAACLYERVTGSTEWCPIQWTTGWSKIEKVMDVMDVSPWYSFFATEDAAKAAFHEFLRDVSQQKENAPKQDDTQQNAPKPEVKTTEDEFDNDLYL